MRHFERAIPLLLAYFLSSTLFAEPVHVTSKEGTLHGFLKLSTLDGKEVANGDLFQSSENELVKMRLRFVFKDGSVHEESTVFSQKDYYKLVSYKLTQKGPTFPQPLEMTINVAKGESTVEYTENGETKTITEKMEMPSDLANGLVLTLMKSVSKDQMPKKFSYVGASPAPRLIDLKIKKIGQDSYQFGSTKHVATHYMLRVDLGAFTGLLAKIFGKTPTDTHIWISEGEVPTFVKGEYVLFFGGPVWRVELAAPSWPKSPTGAN